ncbi:hypothetical protein SALBM311S_06674 [Streptomyces alboniger]
MPADEVTHGTDVEASRVRTGPRHAAPKKPLFTRFHVPAGKAIALAAMPTAVLMGMGFTPTLALADDQPASKSLTADEYKDCLAALEDGASPSASPSPSTSASGTMPRTRPTAPPTPRTRAASQWMAAAQQFAARLKEDPTGLTHYWWRAVGQAWTALLGRRAGDRTARQRVAAAGSEPAVLAAGTRGATRGRPPA